MDWDDIFNPFFVVLVGAPALFGFLMFTYGDLRAAFTYWSIAAFIGYCLNA